MNKKADKEPKTKYLKIRNILENDITNNIWKPGDIMPTEKELMKRFHVSQATIAHAMKELVARKMVIRKPRLGTIVTFPEDRILASKNLSIYISGLSFQTEGESLNWFISEQIHKGIINNSPVKTYLLSNYELNDFISENLRKEPLEKGIILIDDIDSAERIKKLACLPYVLIARISSSFMPANTVNCNGIISAYNAISYLAGELEHRKIAFVTGGQRYHKDYLAGYRMGLDSYGLKFREDYVFCTDGGGKEAGANAGKQFARLRDRPTAVYVDTDLKAIGFIECLRKENIEVPQDVSVVGTDDIPGFSDKAGLTTIHIPFYESGKAAVQMLMKRITNNGIDTPSIPLYGNIVKRQTC